MSLKGRVSPVVLCCIALCCIVLCCVVLCCVVLRCVVGDVINDSPIRIHDGSIVDAMASLHRSWMGMQTDSKEDHSHLGTNHHRKEETIRGIRSSASGLFE